MPDIENLRKQAKLCLRWHRERHYPVAARIRDMLPRFRELTDQQILAAAFRLADAQELVAREQGFENWPALTSGVPPMPKQATAISAKPVLVAAEPQLFVTDMAASVAFFTCKLGFATTFTHGEPPFYAQVARDGARLNLRHVDRPLHDAALAERESYLSASVTVAAAGELKQLFLEFEAAGVEFHQRLKRQPWGARNFIAKGPDGNLLLFASPA
jgi:hypothetical protein